MSEVPSTNQFPYSLSFYPPAPVCTVRLRTPTGAATSLLTGVPDSGADATIVPLRYLEEIDARRSVESGMRSQRGERRRVFLYLLDIEIAEILLPGVYVVGDELGDEIVIGRDVLNRLRIFLDGPDAVARISP